MTPVAVFILPHNYRGPLYHDDVDQDGEAYAYSRSRQEYLKLPIEMPRSVQVTTDANGEVLAIHVMGEGGGQICREDVQQVWRGIRQYNRDCDEGRVASY